MGKLGEEDSDVSFISSIDQAQDICADKDKRLPSPSALAALYRIDDATPETFTAGGYWTALPSPHQSGESYVVQMNSGFVRDDSGSFTNAVRCVG